MVAHTAVEKSLLRAAIARAKRRRRARQLGLGPRLSDLVAATVGSWRFVVLQSLLLSAWLVGNSWIGPGAWDPYPFILLNLLLSFQAAYTAPIIMMSQNRQGRIDRHRAFADYRVNIRAEAAIALLHEKMDLLREQQLREMTAMLHETLERLAVLEAARQISGPAANPPGP
ncbi:putative membrane protein [Humitalea rosea]|uniref:Putative membrane protein n=1 Tax=Humitalea rosea TaxID=990373 RepID=A0A2W7INU4_9PROT|nr:DUF1003 domain-containing protein [Humitalea rosea]PZW48724.1 putative membrane protein [Humitalea rosea]